MIAISGRAIAKSDFVGDDVIPPKVIGPAWCSYAGSLHFTAPRVRTTNARHVPGVESAGSHDIPESTLRVRDPTMQWSAAGYACRLEEVTAMKSCPPACNDVPAAPVLIRFCNFSKMAKYSPHIPKNIKLELPVRQPLGSPIRPQSPYPRASASARADNAAISANWEQRRGCSRLERRSGSHQTLAIRV